MDTFETLYNRRSVRKYVTDKSVTDAALHEILTAAMYAPSAMNKQPWEFVVVRDKEMLETIKTVHPHAPFITDAGTAVFVCANEEQSYDDYGIVDASLAAENLMLAAAALGYGTCFCGIAPNAEREAEFAHVLGLPESVRPIGLIVLGTPAVTTPKPDRFNADKVHFDRW